jgi:hypothetical protein
MTPRAALAQLGKLVGDDLFAGRISDHSRRAGDALAASPESLLMVLDLVIAEGRKKRPNEMLVTGLLFMIGAALNVLRMMIESRHATGASVVDQLRSRLAAAARAGELDPGLFMLIGRQFASAKLDLGDDLRGIMIEVSADHGRATQRRARRSSRLITRNSPPPSTTINSPSTRNWLNRQKAFRSSSG